MTPWWRAATTTVHVADTHPTDTGAPTHCPYCAMQCGMVIGGTPDAPTVAGDTVYAVDLKGVVHALALNDGVTAKWTLDLGEHPQVKSPGLVYGGAVVQGGRLFVATCNLAGAFVNKPTCVV